MKWIGIKIRCNLRLGITPFLVMFFLQFFLVTGCSSTRELTVDPSRLPGSMPGRITSMTTKNGDVVTFDRAGGKYIEQPTGKRLYRAIVGVTQEGNAVEVDPDTVAVIRMHAEEANVFGTILLVLAASGVLVTALFIEAFSHMR